MHPLHVLVVDDDEFIRRWLRRLFADVAFVYLAADASEARTALKEFHFDAVLSDFAMPGEDGLSLLRHVAAVAPESRRVLFSADVPAGASDAVALGQVSAVLEKPARGERVRAAVVDPLLALGAAANG
ncbi:MAG: response regulator [Archangium sp.]|nr:response regulator [Archangium sp.]